MARKGKGTEKKTGDGVLDLRVGFFFRFVSKRMNIYGIVLSGK